MGAYQQSNRRVYPAISKERISVTARRARIHLQMMTDRKTSQIKTLEKELMEKITRYRNKEEETLFIARIVQVYRYRQACMKLTVYCSNVQKLASHIAQYLNNPDRLGELLAQINSVIYSADRMDLFTLDDFKNLLKDVGNPNITEQYITQELKQLFVPVTPYTDINGFVLQFCANNQMNLALFNQAGHHFVSNFEQQPLLNNKPLPKSQTILSDKSIKHPSSIFNPTNQNPDVQNTLFSQALSEKPSKIEINEKIHYPEVAPIQSKKYEPNSSVKTKEIKPNTIKSFNQLDLYPEITPTIMPIHVDFDAICQKLREIL